MQTFVNSYAHGRDIAAHRRLRGAISLATLLLTLLTPCGAMAAEPVQPYLVGVVPQFDVKQTIAIWRPLLARLEQQTGISLTFEPSADIPQFEADLMQGKFDFAYMNPYQLTLSNRSAGYAPLLRDHGQNLQGILVVKKGGGIERLEQLAGKVVTFPSPSALGASLLVRSDILHREGVPFTPHYSRSHTSVYLNVATGLIAAGGGVRKTLEQQEETIRSKLQILATTSTVPSHPFAAHPRLPDRVREVIAGAFIALNGDEAGRGLLAAIPITQPAPASLDDYQRLSALGLEGLYSRGE
ncbi:MAG: phosphate/phosphite/phosphonate ABC transporter substrate-binding protein [Chromatiales bacterium]|nr:phosphate/phosphite/phosphonate ABC transporter substrate-binding protein [Chromatiales bacterium]